MIENVRNIIYISGINRFSSPVFPSITYPFQPLKAVSLLLQYHKIHQHDTHFIDTHRLLNDSIIIIAIVCGLNAIVKFNIIIIIRFNALRFGFSFLPFLWLTTSDRQQPLHETTALLCLPIFIRSVNKSTFSIRFVFDSQPINQTICFPTFFLVNFSHVHPS